MRFQRLILILAFLAVPVIIIASVIYRAEMEPGDWISVGALLFTIVLSGLGWYSSRTSLLADKMPFVDIEPLQAETDALLFRVINPTGAAEIRDIHVETWISRKARYFPERLWQSDMRNLDTYHTENILPGKGQKYSVPHGDGALELVCEHFFSTTGAQCYRKLLGGEELRFTVKASYQPAVTGLGRGEVKKVFRIAFRTPRAGSQYIEKILDSLSGSGEPYLELETI